MQLIFYLNRGEYMLGFLKVIFCKHDFLLTNTESKDYNDYVKECYTCRQCLKVHATYKYKSQDKNFVQCDDN